MLINQGFNKFRAISLTALMLVILVTLACGSATARENTAPAPAVPASDQPADPVPTVASVAVPNAPAEVQVNPGKVTVLLGSLGNERFDYAFSRGTGHDMARIVHGFWISSDIKDGSRILTPGIATNWEVSSDG